MGRSMNARIVALSLLFLTPLPLLAQPNPVVKPLLRLEAGGPSSNVTALAWSADGKTLYAAGFDKVVRAWRLDPATGLFALDDAQSYRVPIGPGIDGALSALAVSPDGVWLAAGGFGIVEGGMKFNELGYLVPVKGGFTPAMRQERGLIYVFNTKDRSVKILKGHTGPIMNLAFARNSDAAPKLISAAEGWDAATDKDIGEAIAWDVTKETLLRRRAMPKLTFTPRPGLAATVDAGVFRAFLAWHDGTLGDWNIATDDYRAVKDETFNLGAALRGDRLVTTNLKGTTGQIQERKVAAELTMGPVKEYPPQEKTIDVPMALSWVGDDAIAALVRTWTKAAPRAPVSDHLDILDARPATFGQRTARIELGGQNYILPVVSAAFGGKHVAVAGFPDHVIRVFAVADVAKADPKVQLLRSAGSTMKVIRFMKKGADQGLAVGAKGVDSVYDFTTRKFADVAGWASDEADPGPYTVTKTATEVQVSKAGVALPKIVLKEGAVTAVQLYRYGETPMVAVASYLVRQGTSILELYDGATGVKIRRFNGHTAPIEALSFRADGKLMASAAQDQTISVWSLDDLKETIGLHGGLGDAAIEAKGNELVVTDLGGIENLQEGDKITGLYGKGDVLKPLTAAKPLYESLWMRKPGADAKLKVVRGGAAKDVLVKVRQGVDVRKPLFSMFLVRDAAGKLSDWIGWNAIGPYDASRREVEKYLGWHFNTGRPEQPTAFAFIDEYRKEYYREGLLKAMIDLGDLPPTPKKTAPKQTLLVPGVFQDGAILDRVAGDFVVTKPAFALRVTVPNYEPLPGDELAWKIDGGAAETLGDPDGNLWTKGVELPAKAGAYRLTVTLKRHPDDQPTLQFRNDFTVRYEPPAAKVAPKVDPKKEPMVKIAEAELPQIVINRPEESFTVQGEGDTASVRIDADLVASATPRPQPFDVIVEIATGLGGKWTPRDKQTVPSDQPRISFDKVPLVPGDNDIRLSLKPVAGGPEQVQEVHGRFVRPPKFAKLTAIPDGKRPFVDVVAEVDSFEKVAADYVNIEVAGKPVMPRSMAIEKGAGSRWTLTARQVPLPIKKDSETRSKLRLTLTTADGEAEATTPDPIVFVPQAAVPPLVTVLEPSLRDSTVSDPSVRVRLKVESDTDLSHVEITRAGKVQKRFDAPIRGKDGTYDFELADVALDWGVNELKMEATNDGGVTDTTVRVNVPPQPVQVAIESMQIGPGAPKLEPELGGRLPPLPIGRATINGVVRWSSADDEALTKARFVRVYVNGFQQLPIALKPATTKSRLRRFEVPVVLNEKDNTMEVEIPELKQDAGNRRKFVVPCDQPITGQQLHVLVVAPQEKEEATLIDGLVRALKAEKIGANLFRTPRFEAVHVHMIARHVQLLEVTSRLDRIAEALKERARAGSPNDLVMLYFQGKDSNGPRGPMLWTSEQSPWLQLSLDDLSKNVLSRFAGGQVLILDTVGAAEELKTGDYRFAMLRRPDARPLFAADTGRVRLMSSLEAEMPRSLYLDQLASAIRDQIQPSPFQGYVPDPLRNRIRLGGKVLE
jgi:WD40 repeat protein